MLACSCSLLVTSLRGVTNSPALPLDGMPLHRGITPQVVVVGIVVVVVVVVVVAIKNIQ